MLRCSTKALITYLSWILSVQPPGCELSLPLPCAVASTWSLEAAATAAAAHSQHPSQLLHVSRCFLKALVSLAYCCTFWCWPLPLHDLLLMWLSPNVFFVGHQSYCVNPYIFQPGLSSLQIEALGICVGCDFNTPQDLVDEHWGQSPLVPWTGRVCEGST